MLARYDTFDATSKSFWIDFTVIPAIFEFSTKATIEK